MSMVLGAFRPHRLRRFVEVARREGARVALDRAATHLRMLAAGQGRGDLALRSRQPSRFALGGLWRDLAQGRAFHVTAAPARLSGRRAVALIGDLNLPQCRKYRVEQMEAFWAAEGIGYRYAHYEDIPRAREILQHATHLVLYRLRRSDLLAMYLYEARRLGLPVLYDIDDPLFSVPAYAGYSNMAALPREHLRHFLDEAPLYAEAMNAADAISLSTPGLLEEAHRFSGRPAFLRRNFADPETLEAGARARAAAPSRAGFTVAVASGSAGHDADLDLARAALCSFLAGGADRRLLILGAHDATRFPAALRPRIETHPFAGYATYLAHLARADCLLVPLTDDPFNRCKSAARALDAAAVGVVPVVSPVGDLPAVVTDGETGLIVADGDWEDALANLARDQDRARAMGAAARAALETRWTARAAEPVADPGLLRWVEA